MRDEEEEYEKKVVSDNTEQLIQEAEQELGGYFNIEYSLRRESSSQNEESSSKGNRRNNKSYG